MDMSAAVQNFWELNKNAIVKPDGISEDDYIPDKKFFDPRKWLGNGEKAVQKAVEELIIVAGSNNKSIWL